MQNVKQIKPKNNGKKYEPYRGECKRKKKTEQIRIQFWALYGIYIDLSLVHSLVINLDESK